MRDRRRAANRRAGIAHRIATWRLWAARRPFRAFVIAVDLVAVIAAAMAIGTYTWTQLDAADVLWALALAAMSVAQLELNLRDERMRELATEGAPYVVLLSGWTFAAVLVLPPPLVTALIAVTYLHSWRRIGRHGSAMHLWAFNAATIVLASVTAGWFLEAVGLAGGAALLTWVGVPIVAAAAVMRWTVNSGLVFLAIGLRSAAWPTAWRTVFGAPADDLVEFAALSLGVPAAAAVAFDAPIILVALALPVLLAQRGLLMQHLERGSQYDPDTAALRPETWTVLAAKTLERATRLGATAGYLVVHVDRGSTTLDPAQLKAVAAAIRSNVRDGDLVGRLPGDAFAVLVFDPETDSAAGLPVVAERLRVAARAVVVDGAPAPVTVSIGGADFPATASTLDQLMLAADNTLFAARSYVRDTVRIARSRP